MTDERGGVTVALHGHPQSYVDLGDPELLAFEYVQQLAACLDTLPAGPLRVTHVGGAGLTLARYVQHTRPGSPQIVLEPDEALTEAVRRELPLPRGHRIRVRGVEGRAGLADLRGQSCDCLVVDAFADGRIPPTLTTREAFAAYTRIVAPGGLLLANLTDEPGLRYVARVAAAARGAGWSHLLLVATHDVLKGRRFGNLVLHATRADPDVPALLRRLARLPFPAGMRSPRDTERLVVDARPLTDADPAPSPPAPDAGRWRGRPTR